MILAVLQARMSSSRLPGKVLKKIMDKPMLALQIERIKRIQNIDHIILATSNEAHDLPLVALAEAMNIGCYQGSLAHVLERFYQAALPYQPEHVVRLTGDCPLLDPEIVDAVIAMHLKGNFDYTSNALEPSLPDGLDVEVMTWQALSDAYREARLPSEIEHVTPFIHRRKERYHLGSFKYVQDYSHLRWTVDEIKDFELITKIYTALYPQHPCFSWLEVLAFVEAHPELMIYNKAYQRNEGLQKNSIKDQEFLEL